MAVPVNQIPNAPNAVPGSAPLPNTPIPGSARAYSAPVLNAPNFSRGNAILSQTAQLLDAPTPQPVEFIDYASRAWADFGATGAKVASNLMDLSVQMQRSRDEGNLAKIDNTLAQSYGDFLTWSQDKQADQLLPEWEKRKAAAMKQFDALPFSETGKAKAQVLIDNKTINYTVDVSTTARKRQIQNADREMETAQKRAEMMGDYETSAGWIAKRKAAGHIDNGTEQMQLLELDKKQQLSGVQQRTAINPFEAEEYFNKVLTEGGGKSKEYDLLDAYAFMQARDNARGQRIQKQRSGITEISDVSLKNPQGTNEAAIRAMAEKYKLPQENTEALVNNWKVAYDSTPEGQAAFAQKQNDLFYTVSKFKPEIDNANGELTPESFKEYMSLDALIRREMPAGHIERFTGVLDRAQSEARKKNEGKLDNAQVIMRQQLTQQVNLMRKYNILGNDGGVDRAGKPVDYPKYLAVEQKQAEVLDAVEGIFERNPNITADEAFKQFQDLFNSGGFGDKAAQEFFRGPDNRSFLEKLGDWFGAAVNPTANNPNVMTAGLSWGSSSLTDGLEADAPLPPVAGAPAAPAGFNLAAMPADKQPVAQRIAEMAGQSGMGDYVPHLMLLVEQESNFNPNTAAKTSSARGLFQLLDGDRKRYGGDNSVEGQIRAGLAKTKTNIQAARRALGRDPDPIELYVIHYQGIGAGPAILKNPDADFRSTLDRTGGKGHASRVMKANKWLSDIKTNQDFIDWVRERLSRKSAVLAMAQA
jgi:hypothetical protein